MKADDLVLEIFAVLEELYERQKQLQQAMQDGYFSMARARYKMGMKRVTADQIVDADLVANRMVTLNKDVGDGLPAEEREEAIAKVTDHLGDLNISGHVPDLFGLHMDKGSLPVSDQLSRNEKGDNTSLVRNRGTGALTGDKEFEDACRQIEGEDRKFKLANPINLFGVLVPQELRSSQKSFEDAVQLSVDVANKQQRLMSLHKKLNQLKHGVDHKEED